MRQSQFAGLFLSLLVFVFAAQAQAGGAEYGQSDELRGVSKVFVDTGVEAGRRELIVKEIRKQLPELEVVSRPEESDIHLRFFAGDEKTGKTGAVGTVVKVMGHARLRVLLSHQDNPVTIFGADSPISSGMEYAKPLIFARVFVKAYKKANA
jgi:hypothetical protein